LTRLGMNTVRREVETASGLVLVVEFTPAGITTREKGRRTTYGPIPYGKQHKLGAMMMAEAIIRERKALRKARKAGRSR
jgi:hypothetical protein